jgi:hypothetical protein
MLSLPTGILTELILAVLALPVGVLLIFLGLRGRRVGDEIFCGGCGLKLADPDARKCPGCAADLSDDASVRIGRHQRQAALYLTGPVAILVGVGMFIHGIQAANVDWNKYAPNWWLLRSVRAGQPDCSDRVLTELVLRMSIGQLSADQGRQLANQALIIQADAVRPWRTDWGVILEAAHERGLVDEAQWQRYWQQSIQQGLRARPRVVAGDPLPLLVEWGRVRMATRPEDAAQPRFRLQLSLTSSTVDSTPVSLSAPPRFCDLSESSSGQVELCLGEPPSAPVALSPGPHTAKVSVEATVLLLNRGRSQQSRASWHVDLTAPF